MAFRAFIFDLDGTLSDSAEGIVQSYVEMARQMGFAPPPAESLRTQVVGPPTDLCVQRVLGKAANTEQIEQGIHLFHEIYSSRYVLQTHAYPGVKALLTTLQKKGQRLFIATMKRQFMAERVLSHLGLAPFFESVRGADPHGSPGGKADLITSLLSEAGIPHADAVMVGDRNDDILGAKACGVRAIGALWGYGSEEELRTAGADTLAATPEDVAAILAG